MEILNKVFLERQFNASIDELFKWLTTPDLMVKWFGPAHFDLLSVETNPVAGGHFQIALKKPGGSIFRIEGEYVEIIRPRLLTFSYRYHGLINPPPNSMVLITLESLEPDVVKLSLTQTFAIKPPDLDGRIIAWQYMFEKLNYLL